MITPTPHLHCDIETFCRFYPTYDDEQGNPCSMKQRCIRFNPTTTSAEQVLLRFCDVETAEYVRLVCRRKNTTLEDYIIDNFEWDDQPECIRNTVGAITSKVCEGCDFSENCPDVVMKQ